MNLTKFIISDHREIDGLREVKVSDSELLNLLGFFKNDIGELFQSWSSISRIKFDAKIFCRASRVVTCCHQNTSYAVSVLLIEVSNIG